MSEQPRTRQELYEEIRRQGGRDVYVLEEMIRLGFWRESTGLPDDPAEEIRRAAELQAELDRLRADNRKLYDEQAMLNELRKKRLAESREKQKETRARRERERQEKAENWRRRKETEILYLGAEVSGGLNNNETDRERLERGGLPVFSNVEELARAMNLTVGKIRFLAYDRRTSETTHYVNFKLPKKTGGHRLISAPMPALKAAQTWILENILGRVAVSDAAHGFLPAKNIVSNARLHVGAQTLVNLDLENFFPSIGYRRVKGIFRAFGYGEALATVFALLTTAPDTEEIELDGKTYFVATGERHLPQGSPASPALSNIAARRLDKGLAKLAAAHGCKYTRYADDLTFSTEDRDAAIGRLLAQVRFVVEKQGFKVNEKKTRVLRRGRQQEVTGIVVNDKLSIDRKTLRKFRAVLFQAETKGLENLRWGNSPDLVAALKGYANFVFMVDKEKGYAFQQQVRRIAEKYDWQPAPPRFPPKKKVEPEEPAPEKPAKDEKPWWKLW
ncbi:MAG: RNA-directed DNA polymerase [Acidobacteria bacterium]|nr:RNA-directed DNA polymerase [Acidobacteriota bacterium]